MSFLDDLNAILIGENGTWAYVLTDFAKLAALSASMRQLYENQFSFGIMAERYEALYQRAAQC